MNRRAKLAESVENDPKPDMQEDKRVDVMCEDFRSRSRVAKSSQSIWKSFT